MNREAKLRRVLPGATDEKITELAARPVAVVDEFVAVARQAKRDERQHQADLKRQRKAEGRKPGQTDESELYRRNIGQMRSAARRAATGDLRSLATMAAFIRDSDTIMWLAAETVRARGVSYADIGSAMGITKQSVWEHLGRQAGLTDDDAA